LRLKGRGREEERRFHTAFGNDVPCGVSTTTTTITAIATCQPQQQLRKDTAAATKRIVLSPLIDK